MESSRMWRSWVIVAIITTRFQRSQNSCRSTGRVPLMSNVETDSRSSVVCRDFQAKGSPMNVENVPKYVDAISK
jgi:hypothetical protein